MWQASSVSYTIIMFNKEAKMSEKINVQYKDRLFRLLFGSEALKIIYYPFTML